MPERGVSIAEISRWRLQSRILSVCWVRSALANSIALHPVRVFNSAHHQAVFFKGILLNLQKEKI